MSVACSRFGFAERGGQTALVASHAELPLLVQRPLRGPAGQAVLVLLTPAGALFDGDALRLEITCGQETDVTLATAAATKLNRCERSLISVEVEVHVAPGATFRYLPHELIPFQDTRYRQRIKVDLEGEARAWLLEVISPGASHARFTYARLEFETEVRGDGVRLARERFSLTPTSAEQLRGHTHYGSLLLFDSELDRGTAAAINERLACVPAREVAGASTLPTTGVVVKVLGGDAESVRDTLLTCVGCPTWLSSALPP